MKSLQSTAEQTASGLPSTNSAPAAALTLPGFDNYKKPRQEFADKIAAMNDADFCKEAQHRIWLSGYADNNPRSDSARRGKSELYTRAHELVVRSL